MEDVVKAHPFGLTNAASIYQNIMQDRLVDQVQRGYDLPRSDLPKVNQVAPTVNMVQIRPLNEDSLLTILEEAPRSDSESSTRTAINYSAMLRHFPSGELFMVNHDSVAQDGETSTQRGVREARNADRA